jgi:ribosomal-protein-alanine N-acetyltransferase
MARNDQAVRVERVAGESAKLLAGLHAACFSGQSGGETWDDQAFFRLLALPGAFAGVIHAGPPAGFVLARSLVGEAELLVLGVLPALRRRGFGRQLLDWTLAQAKAGGAEAVFLEVSEANFGAGALYRNAGFDQVGCREAYYRDGKAAMVLRRLLVEGQS